MYAMYFPEIVATQPTEESAKRRSECHLGSYPTQSGSQQCSKDSESCLPSSDNVLKVASFLMIVHQEVNSFYVQVLNIWTRSAY